MGVRDESPYNELLQELDPKEPEEEEADDWLPQPDEYDDDLLEALLMFPDPAVLLSDEEFCWDVYNGKLKPANDIQWLMISAFCRNEILTEYNVEVEHREWRDAYVDEYGL